MGYLHRFVRSIGRALPFRRQATSAHGRRNAIGRLFDVEGRDRLLAMEGMRGAGVVLVFLQHYCRQFQLAGHLDGPTALFAAAFRDYGNRGVELFFVLSGFLIYGILLRKRPRFFDFMRRRAQRLYPAFLVAVAIACFADHFRAQPDIPAGLLAAARYILENLLFLPGLFPIKPVSAVNWSLSYVWWLYVCSTILFATLGLGRAPPKFRVAVIAAMATLLVGLSAVHVPNVPVRGLSLLAGMMLAEAERAHLAPVNGLLAAAAVLAAFAIAISDAFPEWFVSIAVAASFYALCSHVFFGAGRFASLLCANTIRRLGNMSYSFCLVHGFGVVAVLSLLLHELTPGAQNAVFWLGMAPVFLVGAGCGMVLFLTVERPFSLDVPVPAAVSATAATVLQREDATLPTAAGTTP
jgi:exopolysaccharide production protein ExoZ